MMITVRANEKIMSIFSTDSRVSKTNSVDTDEDWSPSIVINRTIVSKYANKQTLIFISLFFLITGIHIWEAIIMNWTIADIWLWRWWLCGWLGYDGMMQEKITITVIMIMMILIILVIPMFFFLQPLMAAISSYLSGVVGHTQYAIARIHVRM